MSTSSRFSSGAGQDNTFRNVTIDEQTPASNQATLSVTTSATRTIVIESIAAAQTVNAAGISATGAPFKNDELEFRISNSAGTASVVTFGTNFKSAGTASVAAGKQGTVGFYFDGTNWVERFRALTA